ncbi:hypothetical protein [Streptomyces sp. NPDC005876]|jgi:hypothetical protein|uniref:hypothetical protein n=1 Tax=unclassified Streptomyces TaxID=2593676 RepID=UPI0033E4302F
MDTVDLMGGYAAYTSTAEAVRDLGTSAAVAVDAHPDLPLTFILTHLTEILL